jgi:hypothetical protein
VMVTLIESCAVRRICCWICGLLSLFKPDTYQIDRSP